MKNEIPVIEFSDVSKIYVKKNFLTEIKKTVLNNISFSVEKGSITGLVGVNGAGKTTIIKIICGITKPTSGRVLLFGNDISRSNSIKIGYTSEIPYFSPNFSVKDTFYFFYHISLSSLSHREIEEICKITQIIDFMDEKVKNLSRGMLQKLSLACALVNDPEIIILDEPTGGLDPVYVKNIRDILLNLNHIGKTIFFSSHTISEVEKICHKVILINKGRIIRNFYRNEFTENDLEKMVIETLEKDV